MMNRKSSQQTDLEQLWLTKRRKKITDQQIADALKVSRSMISMSFQGRRKSMLPMIGKYLNTTKKN